MKYDHKSAIKVIKELLATIWLEKVYREQYGSSNIDKIQDIHNRIFNTVNEDMTVYNLVNHIISVVSTQRMYKKSALLYVINFCLFSNGETRNLQRLSIALLFSKKYKVPSRYKHLTKYTPKIRFTLTENSANKAQIDNCETYVSNIKAILHYHVSRFQYMEEVDSVERILDKIAKEIEDMDE